MKVQDVQLLYVHHLRMLIFKQESDGAIAVKQSKR
jgi:hypothetical protein